MFRRLVAMAMLFSFVAMATSGMMMFVVEKPSFTLRMHPVHKLFGLVMVVSALAHITLNWRSIRAHLRFRSAWLAAALLTAALVMLYGVVLSRAVPADLATQMDEAAARAEQAERRR